jgi:hypothetical protein
MAQLTIRTPRLQTPVREVQVWLVRAERARRIALTLSKADAEIALAHAAECEGMAARLMAPRQPQIAA